MQFTDYLVETISLILLPVAVLMCAYALTVFIWRARAIAKKQVGPHCHPVIHPVIHPAIHHSVTPAQLNPQEGYGCL